MGPPFWGQMNEVSIMRIVGDDAITTSMKRGRGGLLNDVCCGFVLEHSTAQADSERLPCATAVHESHLRVPCRVVAWLPPLPASTTSLCRVPCRTGKVRELWRLKPAVQEVAENLFAHYAECARFHPLLRTCKAGYQALLVKTAAAKVRLQ